MIVKRDNLVGIPVGDVIQHGLQGRGISVNIGEYSNAHGQCLRSAQIMQVHSPAGQ
jgi:hypothetical protein